MTARSQSGIRRGRVATYAALAALALTLGMVAPAQAATAVQIGGNSTLTITATAKTADTAVKKGSTLHARTTMKYRASFAGIPLPLTAAHVTSFPTTFGRPVLDEATGNLESRRFVTKYDGYLRKTQWMVWGDQEFWGSKDLTVKGHARGATKGSGYFHAGSGTGHLTDANAVIRVAGK